MRTIFRTLRWLTFAAFLVSLGWTIYQVLPPRPRWVVQGEGVHAETESSVRCFVMFCGDNSKNSPLFLEEAEAILGTRDSKAALKVLTERIAKNSKDQSAYFLRAIFHASLGDYQSALRDNLRLLELS